MRRKKRNLLWLILGVIFFGGLVTVVNLFPPGKIIHLAAFFTLIFLSVFFLAYYVLTNVRRALLIATGVVVLLLLRFWGLREPTYPILLIASILSLEFVFRNP